MTENASLPRRIINCLLYGGLSSSPTDRQNILRLNAWAFGWASAYVAGSWLLRSDYPLSSLLTGLIIVVTSIAGLGMLRAYLVFLRDTDELMQRVQLNGLATGFGALVLLGISYSLGESAGLPPVNTNIAIAIGIFSYMAGVIVGMRRYR